MSRGSSTQTPQPNSSTTPVALCHADNHGQSELQVVGDLARGEANDLQFRLKPAGDPLGSTRRRRRMRLRQQSPLLRVGHRSG